MSGSYTNLIEEQAKLTAELETVTTEPEYDRVKSDLDLVQKRIHLRAAQERQQKLDEEAARRKAAIADRMALVKKFDKAKKEAAEQDILLFEKLHAVYEGYSARYDLGLQITLWSEELKKSAEALGLEPIPDVERITVCNMTNAGKTKDDFFNQWVAQYDGSIRALKDARKNRVPCPDRPGMDWYTKGQGQFFPSQKS